MNVCLRHHFSRMLLGVTCLCTTGALLMPQASLALDSAKADIFSTPDTNSPPAFAGRNRPSQITDPLFGPAGDPPGRDAIRAIPSISGAQLKQLDDLINQQRDTAQPLQQEVESLRRIQEQRKTQKYPLAATAAPAVAPDLLRRQSGMMTMMMDDSPEDAGESGASAEDSDESIKARISSLNEQITEIKGQLWPRIRAMLEPQQLNELQQMRYGRLLIANTSPTDVPPPPPDHKPAARPAMPPILRQPFAREPQQYAPPGRPFMYQPAKQPSLIRPLLYTTKQLIYRNLWRLQ